MDQQTVQEAKQLLEEQPPQRNAQRRSTTYTINTTNIGKSTPTAPAETKLQVEVPATKPVEASVAQLVRHIPQVQVLPRKEPLVAPLTTPTPGKRHRTKEVPKLEIVSIQPKQRAFVLKPRQVEVGSLWKLGKSHLLYCGNLDDARFQKLLPQKVELLLRVIPNAEGLAQSVPDGTISGLVLFTPYGGERDCRLFRELVQNAVDLYTAPGDAVVVAYLPDPSIVILMDELEACCFYAEPDPKRCEEALRAWTVTGKQVERG